MLRAFLTGCVLAAMSAVAVADKLILIDGRTFTGTVTVEADTVLIAVPYGTIRFPKTEVERIELSATPEQEFSRRLGETTLGDPNALYNLAQWADHNSLNRQAADLYALILKLKPDHVPARRAAGYVRMDKEWLPFDKALQQAQGKLEAGSYAQLLSEVMPALKASANTKQAQSAVAALLGQTQVRAGQFAAAAETFGDLSKRTEGPESIRHAAIAEIIQKNPDGMYLLKEGRPPGAALLGSRSPSIPPGPASLARPVVLEEALRDLAKTHIASGKGLMEQAQKLERTDPDAAAARYAQAEQAFDRADALIANIAGSYRLEIIRRKIAAVRKDADAEAQSFDEMMKKLGVKDMSPQAYRNTVLRLVHHLDGTRDEVRKILALAKAYPQELLLEVKWAEEDLTKLENLRKILVAELDAKR